MPIETRSNSKLPSSGPFLARITNHLDPTHMGSLEVTLEKGTSNSPDIQSQTHVVQYLSPFYGVTHIKYEGTNPKDFNDVQKSYGMWMIPPDVGTQVMVIFIDGDVNQGYWIGCVPDKFQNFMVPGIAASTASYISPEQETLYGTKNLPVAEFHKRSDKSQISPDAQRKPIHPFADKLMAQGLLIDTVRGVTSSSARREVPSAVFGISTPGPLDPAGKKGLVGYETKATVPVSRLGGSQFVMDDGDQEGKNELVRLRTRTGHQILMHNTDDLIYIANSKGTAWIELTSDGKIDIFATDSVSVHTEIDFNFRADRDVNIEAVRNINLKAGGVMNTNVGANYNLIVGASGLIKVGSSFNLTSASSNNFTAGSTTNIRSSGDHIETAANIHMNGPAAATAASPTALPTFSLPNTNTGKGWKNKVFYKSDNLTSIMKRVPVHEPWPHHENISSTQFIPSKTDNTK